MCDQREEHRHCLVTRADLTEWVGESFTPDMMARVRRAFEGSAAREGLVDIAFTVWEAENEHPVRRQFRVFDDENNVVAVISAASVDDASDTAQRITRNAIGVWIEEVV